MRPVILMMLMLATGCSRSNILLLGRVEASIGGHDVLATDCYRTKVPDPERLANGDFHYMPCRDAEIWIRSENLIVNGTAYGHLGPGDGVLVDHGVVSIQRRATAAR
jgi:hypothetical protein